LLHGTGIYGPTGEPIKPTSAKVLAWENTGNVSLLNPNMAPRAVSTKFRTSGTRMLNSFVFAKSVLGTIWEGKLEELTEAVTEGFIKGIKEYTEE
jgi:hypothetical protein